MPNAPCVGKVRTSWAEPPINHLVVGQVHSGRRTLNAKGTMVAGQVAPESWVRVRNMSSSQGLESGQDLLETNIFTEDGSFELRVPDGRSLDYVQVRHAKEGEHPQQSLLRLRTGLLRSPRATHSQRQTFTLVEAEPGFLKLQSTRKSTRYGAPRSQVWFQNDRTQQKHSVTLDDGGRVPEDYRLPGKITDAFRVKIFADAKMWPPGLKYGKYLAAAVVRSDDFDEPEMIEHTGPVVAKEVDWKQPLQAFHTGNCWNVASIIGIARARPEFLRDMIKPLDDGRFEVTFQRYDHEAEAYVPEPVEVSAKFYRSRGWPMQGRCRDDISVENMELWFPLIDKAYAQLRGSYAATRSGYGVQAFERILGTQPTWLRHNEIDSNTLFQQVTEAIADRQPLNTQTTVKFGPLKMLAKKYGRSLVANHAYGFIDAYERDGERYVKLRNTWPNTGPTREGRKTGIFEITFDEFHSAFGGTVIGRFPED